MKNYQNTSSHIPWFKTILPVGFYNSQGYMAHVNCCCTEPPHTLHVKPKRRERVENSTSSAQEVLFRRIEKYIMKHYSLTSLGTKDRKEHYTRLMSVNSLNSSKLVAHASSCSYPNPVTKSDRST